MTSTVFRRSEEIVGQPTNQRTLIHARSCLQQLDTSKHTTVLVLPTSTGGEKLFEHQGTVADFVLVPLQTAEVGHGTQYGSCQNGTGTQTGAGRDGREQSDFDTRTKFLQLLFERSVGSQ